MSNEATTSHEIAATETHPYRVITEPVPYWDDLLLTVYAITTDGERIRIGAIRSDDGTRWQWLDKASELPVGPEFPTASDAADAMAANAYAAWTASWNRTPTNRDTPAV
ncbi:hypothetical protein ACFXNW_18265 [Nocardia sp. NPDC059180]|uniref:hypothetical protein n=1 Tax=Nocardia sp. NPDC059180 TaxID=3346761 RepID=UPI0036755FB4